MDTGRESPFKFVTVTLEIVYPVGAVIEVVASELLSAL
jgi:hypothetical protein